MSAALIAFLWLTLQPPAIAASSPSLWQTFTASGEPWAIVVGSDKNLWFTEDGSQGALGRLTTGGNLVEYPIPIQFPGALAQGSDGNYYVADQQRAQYVLVTPSGVASLYPVDNDVNSIYSMLLGPDGLVWFSQSNLLGTISPDQHVQTYRMPQPSPHATNIAAGGDRNIWFADYVNNVVGKINPRTKAITIYPVSGTVCTSPSQIIWSANIWFSCHQGATSMLVEMTTSGTIVAAFASPVPIVAITPGLARQTVWFLGLCTDRGRDKRWCVNRMSSSGVVTTYKQPDPNDNDFAVSIDIVVGPDGNLWFTQETPNQIVRFTRP